MIIADDIGAPSTSRKDKQMATTHMVVALAATFIAAQCVHAAETIGRMRVYNTFLATFNQRLSLLSF